KSLPGDDMRAGVTHGSISATRSRAPRDGQRVHESAARRGDHRERGRSVEARVLVVAGARRTPPRPPDRSCLRLPFTARLTLAGCGPKQRLRGNAEELGECLTLLWRRRLQAALEVGKPASATTTAAADDFKDRLSAQQTQQLHLR